MRGQGQRDCQGLDISGLGPNTATANGSGPVSCVCLFLQFLAASFIWLHLVGWRGVAKDSQGLVTWVTVTQSTSNQERGGGNCFLLRSILGTASTCHPSQSNNIHQICPVLCPALLGLFQYSCYSLGHNNRSRQHQSRQQAFSSHYLLQFQISDIFWTGNFNENN